MKSKIFALVLLVLPLVLFAQSEDVGTLYLIYPPQLISPPDGGIVPPHTADLKWSSVAGAAKYNFQLSKSLNMDTLLYDQIVPSTSVQAGGLFNYSTYYWRVRAINGSDTSEWSSVWHFRVHDNSAVRDEITDRDIIPSIIPNPSGDHAVLNFRLASSEFIRIRLFDGQGREIGLLFSGKLNDGKEIFAIPTRDLSVGAYNCVMEINGKAQSVRFNVIR